LQDPYIKRGGKCGLGCSRTSRVTKEASRGPEWEPARAAWEYYVAVVKPDRILYENDGRPRR